MNNKIIKVLAQYEKNNLNPINDSPSQNGINALEVNNILKLLECPEIAINANGGDEKGSNLFIASYYMILQLADRIETLEKRLEDFRFKNRFNSMSKAIRHLLEEGLKKYEKKSQSKP